MIKFILSSIPRVKNITRRDFQLSFMEPLQPVIIRDLASSWPALRKWSPEYLKLNFGKKPVKVYNAKFAAPGGVITP